MTRDFCEFLAEVVASDSILGLRNGASVSSIDQMMGDSPFDEEIDRKGAWMRRDYGLLQVNFNPDEVEGWVSFGTKLSIHRLDWGVSIPIPISELVAEIPTRVYFDEFLAVFETRGDLINRVDMNFRDEMYFKSSSGTGIVTTTKEDRGERVPDYVWAIDLRTRLKVK